jgi:hypothetical protein
VEVAGCTDLYSEMGGNPVISGHVGGDGEDEVGHNVSLWKMSIVVGALLAGGRSDREFEVA